MKLVLEVITGPHRGAKFEFDRSETIVLGRDPSAAVPLVLDRYISRRHFALDLDGQACRLRDLDSRGGVSVNGTLAREAPLADGDLLRAGRSTIRVGITGAASVLRCLACDERTLEATLAPGETPAAGAYLCPACRLGAAQQPQPIPGFELIRPLGRGGMGVVHLARRLADHEPVAIKLVVPESAASETSAGLFLREASVLSRLDHPRIVRFHQVGVAQGRFFLVMEYVPTINIAETFQRVGFPRRVKLACALARQTLEALAYAHDAGFVHRDLKPANLLLTRDGSRLRSKLADFGLAKSFEFGGYSGVTRRGEIRGSIPFMPREQILDGRLAKPSGDIYGLAATLYHLISGAFPHDFPADSDPLRIILDMATVPLRGRVPEVSVALSNVIERGLAREPNDRFATAEEFRAALLPFADGTESGVEASEKG